jgi:hypothetical protein
LISKRPNPGNSESIPQGEQVTRWAISATPSWIRKFGDAPDDLSARCNEYALKEEEWFSVNRYIFLTIFSAANLASDSDTASSGLTLDIVLTRNEYA